jgi:hypothetical protein
MKIDWKNLALWLTVIVLAVLAYSQHRNIQDLQFESTQQSTKIQYLITTSDYLVKESNERTTREAQRGRLADAPGIQPVIILPTPPITLK